MTVVVLAFAALVGCMNLIFNVVTKRQWSEIYDEVTQTAKAFDFIGTSSGRTVAIPKENHGC